MKLTFHHSTARTRHSPLRFLFALFHCLLLTATTHSPFIPPHGATRADGAPGSSVPWLLRAQAKGLPWRPRPSRTCRFQRGRGPALRPRHRFGLRSRHRCRLRHRYGHGDGPGSRLRQFLGPLDPGARPQQEIVMTQFIGRSSRRMLEELSQDSSSQIDGSGKWAVPQIHAGTATTRRDGRRALRLDVVAQGKISWPEILVRKEG